MSRRLFQPMFGVVRPTRVISTITLIVLMLVVFVTDSLTQLGFAHGYLYIPIILLASAIARMRTVIIVTCCALVLNSLGYLISPEVDVDLDTWYVLANRSLTFVIIGATYVLLHIISRAEKSAAKNLQVIAQKEYFKELSDALPVMVWTANPDGTIAYVGSQLINITGKSSDYILEHWKSILHPDDLKRSLAIWDHSVATGEHYLVEFRIRDYQGNYVWMLTQAKPKYNTEGEVEAWYGSCSDITKQRAEQEQLRLLRTAVSRLNDIIIITEAEPVQEPGPRVVFVNEAFERKTGYTAEEIIGKTPRILQGPGTQSSELDKIRSALLKWKSVRAKVLNYTKDGREIWLELDIVPIADKNGWYTHWVAVERDVTREHNMEQQLQQIQRLESISHLTGGIAHDFNNLLTVVMGNADMLCETLTDDSQRQLAETIVQASERGAALTNSLLAFARRQTLNPTSVDIETILDDLSPLLKTAIGRENELIVKVEPHLPSIFIDHAQLENALLNLATNSKHAMPANGEFTIEASVSELDAGYLELHPEVEPGSYLLLKVSDNGHGIPSDDIERIFEPFFSRREDNSGTGLGLSMVFGFIKQSGGHISVCSETAADKGSGTTFCLYLPLIDSASTDSPSVSSADTSMPAQLTVLVVEDEAPIRQLAVNYFESEGFQVLEAENAEKALQHMEAQQRIDFLFTDVVMPGELSGVDVANVFAKRYPSANIMLTSGFSDKIVERETKDTPRYPILSKPYRKEQLMSQVSQALKTKSK
ncbi:PAS domain S-box-containing protein [Pseudidiomarina planktonica]|uniref:histidine kinase n=1 Tax=Pseudidiomarina planktonica TaxID=1323738 RepID=A0A1Y6G425_9GAMM|nr:PAS domain-containing sensor histidine kinase [Pseudidiomarina planktonica]RUO63388.1 PAS domain-containing sensor histidine kinase [Pseudidiomarina planktonica]SMQ80379.1 PAS domain S-box-containing protein [Pseudidiomarina planktonica]